LIYRRDVDGLRAVAVLAVVVYHLGLPLHGGFIGVDVFFTISGFLIGSNILRESERGEFSLLRFYERRIRRIVPALVVMLALTTVAACRFLLPGDLSAYARSLIAAVLSVSNLEFWHESGYFDQVAATKPLLHTWSLSVEEQFYVFFPLLVLGLRRRSTTRRDAVLLLIGAASLAYSSWCAYASPTEAFYGPHTRAWELLMGTAVALWNPVARWPALGRDVVGFVGLALVVVPMFLYNAGTPFPGLAALPPCLGTALIIAVSQQRPAWVGRLLGLPPMVWIGMISYSLYLWHWPVIAFDAYGAPLVKGLGRHPSQWLMFATALALACLSWRFVEQPFRRKALLVRAGPLAGCAGASALLAIAFAGYALATDGWSGRFPPAARQIAAWVDKDPLDSRPQYRIGHCFLVAGDAGIGDLDRATCLRDGGPRVLLVGDSHASALWWGLNAAMPRSNVMEATASGCKPVLHQRPRQRRGCSALMTYMLTDYLKTNAVDAVVIVAHWDAGDLPSLDETLRDLRERGIPAVVVGPMVQYDAPLPRLLAYSMMRQDPALVAQHRLVEIAPLDKQMQDMATTRWHVPYFSMVGALCAHGSCREQAEPGVPMLSDYGHVTKKGAELVAREMVDQVDLLRNTEAAAERARPGDGAATTLAAPAHQALSSSPAP
jgi:peptidoglycan/LPS O-acetylase OafA/YrhL